jgi:hypothetical protein
MEATSNVGSGTTKVGANKESRPTQYHKREKANASHSIEQICPFPKNRAGNERRVCLPCACSQSEHFTSHHFRLAFPVLQTSKQGPRISTGGVAFLFRQDLPSGVILATRPAAGAGGLVVTVDSGAASSLAAKVVPG